MLLTSLLMLVLLLAIVSSIYGVLAFSGLPSAVGVFGVLIVNAAVA